MEKNEIFRISVRKPLGKRQLGRQRKRPEGKIKTPYENVLKRHLQSFADLWPTLMGFSIYI
jgi:hypothetical protein